MPIKGKYGYSLQVEVLDKFYFYHFKHAWECEMWMHGLRKAADVEKEVRRTVHGVIKHNIGILYFYFNSHLDADIIKIVNNILSPLAEDLEPLEFADALKCTSAELNYFFDAFYARKPFVFMLFKFVVAHIQTSIKTRVCSYWNRSHAEMNAGEIIALIGAFAGYEKVLRGWGIEDSRSAGWVTPLLKTFIKRIYGNCRQILANILYDLRNNYTTYNHYLVTRSSESLEAHLNFIFDHYAQVQDIEAAELLTDLCASILELFLMNARGFLREDEFPLQIYFALLNNTFLKVIKNFTKKVHGATNSQLSLKQIKARIDEEFLITAITDIERLSFNKIVEYVRVSIAAKLDAHGEFLEVDLGRVLPSLVTEFETLFNLVDNRFYVSDLFNEVFECVIEMYYNNFIDFCPKISGKNINTILAKLKSDEQLIEKAMSQTKTEASGTIRFKLKQLVAFAATEDLDEVLMCLMNMHLQFKTLIRPATVDKLLRAKIFFPAASVEYISSYLHSSLTSFAKSNELRTRLLNIFIVYPQATAFVKHLSEFIRGGSEAGRRETSEGGAGL